MTTALMEGVSSHTATDWIRYKNKPSYSEYDYDIIVDEVISIHIDYVSGIGTSENPTFSIDDYRFDVEKFQSWIESFQKTYYQFSVDLYSSFNSRLITYLPSHHYKLKRSIPITIDRDAVIGWSACFSKAQIAMPGSDPIDAKQALAESIVDAFGYLNDNEGILGPFPMKQLKILRDYVKERVDNADDAESREEDSQETWSNNW